MKFVRNSTLFAIAAFLPAQAAIACPDGWSSTSLGFCMPDDGTVIDVVLKPGTEAWAQQYGPIIATWLQASRETAYSASQPIPAHVRAQLSGFVPDDVLNRARYKVDDNGVLNAAADILRINGDIAAVTLVDVIVFRNGSDAQSKYKLWAHELKHVRQFMDWGTLDFGIHSARNYYSEVEQPALDEGERYASWNPPRQATVCVTPTFTCTMTAIGPVGQSCYCPTQFGPIYGTSM